MKKQRDPYSMDTRNTILFMFGIFILWCLGVFWAVRSANANRPKIIVGEFRYGKESDWYEFNRVIDEIDGYYKIGIGKDTLLWVKKENAILYRDFVSPFDQWLRDKKLMIEREESELLSSNDFFIKFPETEITEITIDCSDVCGKKKRK